MVSSPFILVAALFALSGEWPMVAACLLPAVLAAGLVLLLRRPRTVFNVVVQTAGGQGEVITTPREGVADEIAAAISAAIVAHRRL